MDEVYSHTFEKSVSRNNPEEYPWWHPAFTKCACRQYRMVSVRGDSAFHNILVRENQIVVIIDWESAGWFPEYWDYTWLLI